MAADRATKATTRTPARDHPPRPSLTWRPIRVPNRYSEYESGTAELSDGTVGYLTRGPRLDDCFAAAVASTLQVPIAEVPDPRIDERLRAGEPRGEIDRSAKDEMRRWLARRGLRMIVHRNPPAARRRWIGVILGGWFTAHCLVMNGPDVLFDPTDPYSLIALAKILGRPEAVRLRPRMWGAEHVDYGLSFRQVTRGR